MTQARPCVWALLTAALAVTTIDVRADKLLTKDATPAVITNHATLQHSLNRLFARSALWRSAVKSIERLGRKVVVVTPKHVRVKDPESGKLRAFDHGVIAEVQPLAEHETLVDAVVVVVNLDLLERLQGSLTTIGDFEDDLDRILAHEVYGHAFPYLLAGDLAGKCADPVKGQRAEDACAIKRENEIRAELRLGQRREYGLDGLTLARRYRN
jgi:hypothetical protein